MLKEQHFERQYFIWNCFHCFIFAWNSCVWSKGQKVTESECMRVLFGRCICSGFHQISSWMISGAYTHSRHAKASNRGRRWRSQSVMFSLKVLWNHHALVPNGVMETWTCPLLSTYTVCKHAAKKKGDTLYTGLLCFGGFVLTASMFYLPRPFFSWMFARQQWDKDR